MDPTIVNPGAPNLVRIDHDSANLLVLLNSLVSPNERNSYGGTTTIGTKRVLVVDMSTPSSTGVTERRTSLMSLPNEILISIFDIIKYEQGKCRAVAFGLIHPRMYNILKDKYPKPIFDRDGPSIDAPSSSMPHISHHSETVLWRWEMQYIIRNFLGPKYRRRRYDLPSPLNDPPRSFTTTLAPLLGKNSA